ncbi:5-formyltetrahydrofolate cyclo-ligase [Kocuria sp.]|uniref:5-formyltetrahydrofolate cyclo-ligase n=1 Tax=Kocuria sp. TaxID=1871328 RepID=UPI0026DBD711|nr:5-formyltetrahydrofolate cyclo-ligase [Kocuria sp.]MDO4918752.1 5-formyltetrahydrofolate cyclo-ligase [Kocuria sp.]
MTHDSPDAEAKARLRAEVLGRRRRRSAAARRAAEAGFVTHLAGLLSRAGADDVAAFLPLPGEPPLLPALAEAHRRGHRVWLPVVEPLRQLSWVRWHPEVPLVPGTLPELLEPAGERHGLDAFATVGLVVVPVVAVDGNGVRLGFGGGYYDRFLPRLAAAGHAPEVVACCFADEVLPAGTVPREPHDAVLAEALTERGPVRLGGDDAAAGPGSATGPSAPGA